MFWLWGDVQSITLYYQLKVTESQSTRQLMCLLIIQWQWQRNTRCETGRGPTTLLLGFTREFAFEEILMLLHLQYLLLFLSFFRLSFSLLFPHFPLGLPLCFLPHPFPFPVLCLLLELRSQLFRRYWGVAQDAGRASRDGGHVPWHRRWHCPWRLFITLRPGLACSLTCNNSACFRLF